MCLRGFPCSKSDECEGWARVEYSNPENINFARLKKIFFNIISHLDGKIY